MTIEVMVRWPDIDIRKTERSDIDRLIDGEEDSVEATIKFVYTPMCMELTPDISFNQATDSLHTVVRYPNGDVRVIKFPYEDFKRVFIECTGKTILTLIEKPKRRKKGEDLI